MLTFEVKISDSELEDCWNAKDLLTSIREGVIDEFVNRMYSADADIISEQEVREVIKEHKKDIVDKVIQNVTEGVTTKILRQKEIIASTPKVSELNAINRENEKYFMELIDKAIAKKFK